MKKLGVIINPNAKKFRTGQDSVASYLKYSSENVFIFTLKNSEELQNICKSCKSENVDYICIGGGDGTIHLVLSELINLYNTSEIPPILILKEGTMNNIARSIHLKGRGPKLLKSILKKLEKNQEIEIFERHTMKINNKYCFLFGTGYVTNFLSRVYSGNNKGFIKNLQVGLSAIKEIFMKPKDCRIFTLTEQAIFIDGKKVLINPVSGILAGTVEHIGMGFSPLIDAVQKDGRFQSIILGLTPWKILINLNKVRTGKRLKSPKYFNSLGKSINIKQKGIFNYTMDGEIYSAENELKIGTGPTVKLVKI